MDIFRKYNAKAIWYHETMVNHFVRFQDQFKSQNAKAYTAYICADTNYELYINGVLVGFGQYADFPEEKKYDTYDITEFVKEGSNLISVLGYSQGRDSSQRAAGIPMVKFAVVQGDEAVLVSSEKTKCSPAKEFRSGEIERICYERPYNLELDLREDDGWRENYVSQNWDNGVVCDDSKVAYGERPVGGLLLREVQTGKPAGQGVFTVEEGDTPSAQMQYAALAHRDCWNFMKRENGVIYPECENAFWIMDLGEETAGYYMLDIEADAGAVMDIALGEHLDDLRVRSFIGGRNYGFRTVCREGRQKFTCYIHRFAGRYLQVFAHKGIKAVHCIGIQPVEYAFPYQSQLKTGDRLFDKIYQVSSHTLNLCVHEHYEDGPHREQSLYGFDSRNQMLMGYYAFGETRMPRACLDLLSQHSWDCGLLTHIAPGSYHRTIPSFSLAWVAALLEYTLFSGDLDFAREKLPVARGVLEFFARHQREDGVVICPVGEEYWNFYGWMDGLNGVSSEYSGKPDALASGFFAVSLKNYQKLAELLQDAEEEEWAKERAMAVADSFHNCFYDPEKKAYRNMVTEDEPQFAQLTQAWALLGGCVPEEYRSEIVAALLDESLVSVELSYLLYKYDALMQVSKDYADIVLDDIEEKWGKMLYAGATSFWETTRGADDFGYAGSLCHGWAAVPIYVFWRYMMGVYPEKPGIVERTSEPAPGWEKAYGSLYTPQGIVKF